MDRDVVRRRVDKAIEDVVGNAYESSSLSPTQFTVEAILRWVEPAITNEPELSIASERAREWLAERNLVHLSDTDRPSHTRCGKSIIGLRVHTGGPTDAWNMCPQCTAPT